ncbi:hypothetical protein B0T14DRAFT_540583 [Immersiella caudata]|uniref:Uncharacterized protein n=1 Tax=Immersiella caudata TaxID=314043 RepID=A0AA39TY24_9PEZI|nr:hypothetical protein B0T14DRAFT_540583 [Immersiella caudata]
MRPTTPNFKIPRSVGPTSPPETPTTASPVLGPINSSKPGSMPPHIPHLHSMAPGFTARAVKTKGPNFSHAQPGRPGQLSPRSSNTSLPSDSDSDDDAPPSRSGSLSPGHRAAPTPPSRRIRTGRTVHNPALVIEELSDFRDSDNELPGIIRPTAIEDAESDRSRSRPRQLPEAFVRKINDLNCDSSSDDSVLDFEEADYQEFLRRSREAKRRKRMTSGSIGKRTITESLGSDSDHEDLNKPFLSVEEAGSSARRLRRKSNKFGNRHSLQFQDPPPGIEELDEPESSEDEYLISEALARELPYYEYSVMEVDSP